MTASSSNSLHLWLIPLVPFLGFLLNGLFGRRLPRAAVSAVALIATAIPLVLVANVWLRFNSLSLPYVERLSTPWIATSTFHASFAFSLDQLTLIMLSIITGVGFLIHLYSVGYMAHEEGYYRFFAYLNLFMFFMLTLVLSENFLLLFVGWEGVGLASYLLIGFYYQRDSAANAGKKAFIVNRIGDFGFLLAMFLLIAHFGTLSFNEIFAQISQHPEWTGHGQGGFLTAIALLLVVGATGKSAQIPLYVWLPDAMEGPTPVSALIHAATMVTAGIYLVVRSHVLFDRAPIALGVVAVIGAATAFFAATIGIVQTDIKRVLAYSTISQLGYMFMACGAAAYSAGIFHLLTHAFFKALLFLAAGSVIHAVGGEQDMRKMGGLRIFTPVTFWTMTAAVLAISGLPPFAGFFSKDEILAEVYRSPYLGHLLWFVGLFTAFLTAFYMFRLWYMTFFGAYRGGESHEAHGSSRDAHAHSSHDPHESPWVMLLPLVLLAILSVVGGWVGIPAALGGHDAIGHFLEPVVKEQALNFEQTSVAMMQQGNVEISKPVTEPVPDYPMERLLSGLSVFAGLLGLFFADLFYRRKPELPAKITEKIRGLYWLVENKYRVDEIYGGFIVRPLLFLSKYVLWIFFDRALVDGAGAGIGGVNLGLGMLVRRIQSGNIRSYAGWLAFGAAALLLITYFGLGTHLLIH